MQHKRRRVAQTPQSLREGQGIDVLGSSGDMDVRTSQQICALDRTQGVCVANPITRAKESKTSSRRQASQQSEGKNSSGEGNALRETRERMESEAAASSRRRCSRRRSLLPASLLRSLRSSLFWAPGSLCETECERECKSEGESESEGEGVAGSTSLFLLTRRTPASSGETVSLGRSWRGAGEELARSW